VSGLGPQATELAAAVSERELLRLLGMPRGRGLQGELRERAEGARAWYASQGRPFAASCRVGVQDLSASVVRLTDGTELRSPALAEGLRPPGEDQGDEQQAKSKRPAGHQHVDRLLATLREAPDAPPVPGTTQTELDAMLAGFRPAEPDLNPSVPNPAEAQKELTP